MRRISFGTIVVLAGMANSSAMAQATTHADWSGFYAGGLLGATQGKVDMASNSGSTIYFAPTETVQLARVSDKELKEWRPAGALVGGYGKQFGNVYVGIDLSANSLLMNDKRSVTETYVATPGTQFTLKQSASADWMATLRPRLGWAEGNWLAYVTGGIAVTRLHLNTTFTDNAWSAYSRSSVTKTLTGRSIGFGAEYALGQQWAFRGEYLHTRFGKTRSSSYLSTTNAGGGYLGHSGDFDAYGLLLGVTYRFQ